LTYIRLNAAQILMNFVLLAALIFGVYFQQIAIHFEVAGVDATVPLRAWLACMALIYAVLAAMYAISIWQRRRELDASAIRWGVNLTYQAAIGGLGLAALCFTIPHNWTGTLLIVIIAGVASALGGIVTTRVTGRLRTAH
jgi:hypothetical protein